MPGRTASKLQNRLPMVLGILAVAFFLSAFAMALTGPAAADAPQPVLALDDHLARAPAASDAADGQATEEHGTCGPTPACNPAAFLHAVMPEFPLHLLSQEKIGFGPALSGWRSAPPSPVPISRL